jgi:hypothetical protein
MISCDHGVPPFTGAQSDMYVNDMVMSPCRTQEADASGNVKIHYCDLDIRRIEETSQPDLPWAAPSLCNHRRWDTQRPSALPELFDAELHHLSFRLLIDSEERAGVESKTSDPRTSHPAIRSPWSPGWPSPIRSNSAST